MNFKTLEQYQKKEKEFLDEKLNAKRPTLTIKALYIHLGINKAFIDDLRSIIKDYANAENNSREYNLKEYVYPYISYDDEALAILTEKTDKNGRLYWTLPKLRRLFNYLVMSREKVINAIETFGLYNPMSNPQMINSYLKANNKDVYGSDAYILSLENKFKPINIVFKNESDIKITLPNTKKDN